MSIYFSLGTHLLPDKMADPTLEVTSYIIKNPSPTALIFTSGLSTCRQLELQFMELDCRLTIFIYMVIKAPPTINSLIPIIGTMIFTILGESNSKDSLDLYL